MAASFSIVENYAFMLQGNRPFRAIKPLTVGWAGAANVPLRVRRYGDTTQFSMIIALAGDAVASLAGSASE